MTQSPLSGSGVSGDSGLMTGDSGGVAIDALVADVVVANVVVVVSIDIVASLRFLKKSLIFACLNFASVDVDLKAVFATRELLTGESMVGGLGFMVIVLMLVIASASDGRRVLIQMANRP